MVVPGIAGSARVCAYERPGVAALTDGLLRPSRSDPAAMPRSASDVVADLRALLRAAGVPGPYVLVGHSLGGLFVRLYAASYPDDVVGLVLVDAWSEELERLLTPQQWAAYIRLNYLAPPELASYRDLETIDFAAASAEMRRAAGARPLRPLPLAVISHGVPFGISPDDLGFSPDALERAWSRAQYGLATLGPRARRMVAAESGHYIQLEQPELVIAAVREVVEAARGVPPAAIRGLPRTGAGHGDR
jgi:pimeloyl-ACP methyl ester carboxylesterase